MRLTTLLLLFFTASITTITALPLDDLFLPYPDSFTQRDASLAIRPRPNRCPNFANLKLNIEHERKAQALFSYSKCNWKQTLICVSLVVGCPVACAGVITAGINPFAIAECVACAGLVTGNCAFCFEPVTEQRRDFCRSVLQFPAARCLMPLCEGPKLNWDVPKVTS